jgi:Smg protein
MKENVLDVLMYLFQNYMCEEIEIHPDRESMHHELLEAGFPSYEVSQAFEWLDGLSERQAGAETMVHVGRSFRIYAPQEMIKLDAECQGFLLFLEEVDILNSETRELVIDRVLALQADDIDLYQLKWIVLMVLFNQPGQEEAYACMEDLVFEDASGYLH